MRVLVRFFNATNLGDDLFIKILTERYPSHTFILPTYPRRPLPKLGNNVKIVKLPLSQRLFAAINKLINYANFQLWMLSKRCDLMVYIGGSIFMEPRATNTWDRELKFYRSLTVPFFIIGANVGPYVTKRFIPNVTAIFKEAQDVCLRDHASRHLVGDVKNVRVAPDIAFLLDISQMEKTQQGKRVVISVIDAYRRFDSEIANRYEQAVIQLSMKFSLEGYKITLMSFCGADGDEAAIHRIVDSMNDNLRQHVTYYGYNGNLTEALDVMMQSDIVIASRFHAAILGMRLGKKVLPLAYSDKTLNTLKDLEFLGPVIDIREIDKLDVSTFDLKELRLNDVSSQAGQAERQFEVLDRVLAGKR